MRSAKDSRACGFDVRLMGGYYAEVWIPIYDSHP